MPISPDRLLYEDEHLLAVTKLGGELVVRGKGRVDRLPLLDFLQQEYPGLKPVHRLDFETSGVVVFAKNPTVLDKILRNDFKGWKKKYLAIVIGHPAEKKGDIDIALSPRSGIGKVDSHTGYKVIEEIGPVSLVEADIEGGQFHQIRRHFAMIKHPLVLDDEHGDPKFNRRFSKLFKLQRFFLHASSVSFPHPVTGMWTKIDSPLPHVFEKILKDMRKQAGPGKPR